MQKTKNVKSIEQEVKVDLTAEEVRALIVAKAGGKKATEVSDFAMNVDGSASVVLLFKK